MAHPMNHVRQSKVEKSRVSHLTKRYAAGGAVHSDEAQDKALIRKMVKKADLKADGEKSKHRMDRPKRKRADGGPAMKPPIKMTPDNMLDEATRRHQEATAQGRSSTITGQLYKLQGEQGTNRAKGGRVKKGNAKTIVNVISGGHPAAGAVPPMPAPPPMGVAGPPPGGMPPPMAARPPMPMPPPGGPPTGMPTRAKGGRVQTPTGTGVAEDSGVGSNKGDAVFNASRKNGTHISHSGNKDDGKDIGRGRVVTFNTGGGVKSFRAFGGRVESPDGVAAATKLPGGSGGGKARLAKEHRAERKYAKAEK